MANDELSRKEKINSAVTTCLQYARGSETPADFDSSFVGLLRDNPS